jgi:hypothetical protein
MPITYEIDRDESIVTVRGDAATPDEWRILLDEVANEFHDQAGQLGVLRDRREAVAPMDTQTIMSILDVVAQLWSGVRLCGVAILTRHADDRTGQISVAVADSRGFPLMAFDSEDAARAWLRSLVRGCSEMKRP